MKNLPTISLNGKPAGLTFRAPKSALERWDGSIQAAKTAKPEEGTIDILGEIGDPMWGGVSAGMVKEALAAIGNAPVLITLNSPGGDAFEGIAIFNVLREHTAQITVRVIGMAASAASVIAMAGDKIIMAEATTMMIHSAWGLVVGNKDDMRDFAAVLDMLDKSVAGLYAARTGIPQDDVLAMMAKETWMSAADAVEKGFADSVEKDPKKKAKSSTKIPVFASARPGRLAASGDHSRTGIRLSATRPGASGKAVSLSIKGDDMTHQERIEALEAKRAATVARMAALDKISADENRTLDETEQQEFDTLDGEVKSVDEQLVRSKRMAALALQSAKPVEESSGTDPEAGTRVRGGNGGSPILFQKANIEKGIPFARYAMAMYVAQGNPGVALSIVQQNKRWMDTSPQVAKFLMTAVGAGTTAGAGWADDLVYAQNLSADFVDLLRAATIVDRLGLRPAPFNIRVGTKTSGTTGYWVGQGRPIPMSKLATDVLTLDRKKVAGLSSITEELALDSSPSAELMVRDDLRDALVLIMDQSFIDPDRAEVSGISPASVTYGVSPIQPSGTTAAALRSDVARLFQAFVSAGITNFEGGKWIMTASSAINTAGMVNALGQPEFPTMNMAGGTFMGFPVIVSQTALATSSPTGGNLMIFVLPREVLLADDGAVDIQVSREASLEMSDAPTNRADDGTGASLVSMFQNDSLALRAIRFVNWKKRRTGAVQFINDAEYVA